jgi:hypothetical protein
MTDDPLLIGLFQIHVNRTDWHRIIAEVNLLTFAAALKEGTLLSAEGELRCGSSRSKADAIPAISAVLKPCHD